MPRQTQTGCRTTFRSVLKTSQLSHPRMGTTSPAPQLHSNTWQFLQPKCSSVPLLFLFLLRINKHCTHKKKKKARCKSNAEELLSQFPPTSSSLSRHTTPQHHGASETPSTPGLASRTDPGPGVAPWDSPPWGAPLAAVWARQSMEKRPRARPPCGPGVPAAQGQAEKCQWAPKSSKELQLAEVLQGGGQDLLSLQYNFQGIQIRHYIFRL